MFFLQQQNSKTPELENISKHQTINIHKQRQNDLLKFTIGIRVTQPQHPMHHLHNSIIGILFNNIISRAGQSHKENGVIIPNA